MGKSKSIEDMQKTNDKFNTYLNKIKADLEKAADKEQLHLETERDKYYTENKYNKKRLWGNRNTDFRHEETWSLDKFKNMIQTVSSNLFGSPEVKGVAEDNGITLDEIKNLELVAVGKAFKIISGVLDEFKTSTALTSKTSYKHAPIGYGLHLFITVCADSFKQESFFNNKVIMQALFIYEVNFSQEEAEVFMKIGLIKTYTDELATYEARLKDLLTQLQKKEITVKEYKEEHAVWDELIDAVTDKVKKLKAVERAKIKEQALLNFA